MVKRTLKPKTKIFLYGVLEKQIRKQKDVEIRNDLIKLLMCINVSKEIEKWVFKI